MRPGLKKTNLRLAFRKEGRDVVAYIAELGTMSTADEIGRIRAGALAVTGGSAGERWREWRTVCENAFADLVEEATGERPVFGDPERAPEHERAGHG